MTHSMHTADFRTHVRIVSISLTIGIVVVLSASYARNRPGNGDMTPMPAIAANVPAHALLR